MGIRPNKLLIQSLQLSWLYSLQDRLFISCLGPTKHLKKLMLKVCGENIELPPRARCPAGAALSSQQRLYSRQGELYKATFAECAWRIPVHPERSVLI